MKIEKNVRILELGNLRLKWQINSALLTPLFVLKPMSTFTSVARSVNLTIGTLEF